MKFTATRRLAGLTALAAAASFSLASATAAQPALASAPCDLVAAVDGSDAQPGTTEAPMATPAKVAESLAPGQRGCLRAGTYVASEPVRMVTENTTLSSFPGESATLRGRLRIEATATGSVVEDLLLDGRNANNELSPLVYASGAVLRNNEITNHHTAICVHVDQYEGASRPTGVLIEGNRIHDCGELPASNFDHGIYIGEADGTVIRDNWIYDNADRGVQLYSEAQGSRVVGNVIDGNGQGVIFGGESENPSSNNVVEQNVISNSTIRDNVESSWGGAPGTGNVVRNNCIGGGAYDEGDGGILDGANLGFKTVGNILAEPQFVNRAAGDFTIVPGSACDFGAPSVQRVTLKASSHRVEAGTPLRLKGKSPGASVVRILMGAHGSWKTVRSISLRGRTSYNAKVTTRHSGRVRFKAVAAGLKDSKRVRVSVKKR